MSKEIRDRLQHFEAQPSSEAWERIAAVLDEQALGKTGQRLAEFESQPAPSLWKAISLRLDKFPSARVVPFFGRYARPLRYGAAVAILVLIAVASNLLMDRNTEAYTPVRQTISSTRPAEPETDPAEPAGHERAAQGEIEETLMAVETTMGIRGTAAEDLTRKTLPQTEPIAMAFAGSTDDHIPDIACRNRTIEFSGPEEKYMVYSREDGSVVRVPRRLFEAVTCPARDPACEQNLKKVQEQFASSALRSDFTGVLEILNHLSENQ